MYTYLIGWSEHNKYYYGVRYAKDADPSDLWVKYFTSSAHVKRFRSAHGEPDVIQVRKIFANRDDAIKWENTVLRRLEVVEDSRFFNATYNSAIPPATFNRIANLAKRKRYQEFDNSVKEKIKNRSSENAKLLWAEGKLTGKKDCDPDNYIAAANRRWADPTFKEKMKSRRWMHNGVVSNVISANDIETYLSDGWAFGRGVR